MPTEAQRPQWLQSTLRHSIQVNSSSVGDRPRLNFGPDFQVTDNQENDSTDVAMSLLGPFVQGISGTIASGITGSLAAVTQAYNELSSSFSSSLSGLSGVLAARGWPDVLANEKSSGLFNPHIPGTQYVSFGDSGSLPAQGQLRSSTAFGIVVLGSLELSSSTDASVQAGDDLFLGAFDDATLSADDVFVTAADQMEVKAGSNLLVSASVDVDIQAGDDVLVASGDDVLVNAGDICQVTAGSGISLVPTSQVGIFGSGVLQVGSGATTGWVQLEGGSSAPQATSAGDGAIWCEDPSNGDATRPMWTDDDNVTRTLLPAQDARENLTTQTNSTNNAIATTITIPANTVRQGDTYRLTGCYRYDRGATATASSLRGFFSVGGAITVSTGNIATQTGNGDSGTIRIEAIVTFLADSSAATPYTASVLLIDTIASTTVVTRLPVPSLTATTDTTVDRSLSIRAQFTVAVADLSVTALQGCVERLR